MSLKNRFGMSLSFLKALHYKNAFESVKAYELFFKNFYEAIKDSLISLFLSVSVSYTF